MMPGIYEVKVTKRNPFGFTDMYVELETTIDSIETTGRSGWKRGFYPHQLIGFEPNDLSEGNVLDIELYCNGYPEWLLKKWPEKKHQLISKK